MKELNDGPMSKVLLLILLQSHVRLGIGGTVGNYLNRSCKHLVFLGHHKHLALAGK